MSGNKALVMVSSVGKCNGIEGSHVCGNDSRGESTGLEAQNRTLDLLLFFCFLIFKKADIYTYSAYIIDRIVLRVTAEMFMGESAL